MRPVLKGVLYRSGTPSEEGLSRLCKGGFRRVYSLYGARTSAHGPQNEAMRRTGADGRRCAAPGPKSDSDSAGDERELPWLAATAHRGRSVPRILRDVVEAVRDPDRGPLLIHCWNGLHYAGMVSAMVLRQLCGASVEVAEAYWRATANKGANYPGVIRNIRNFRPIPGLSLTPEEQKRVCPDLREYKLPRPAEARREQGPVR